MEYLTEAVGKRDITNEPLPTVTVVIPIRNEERYIAQCLKSVADQDYPAYRLEILVVDSMSDDRSREIVVEFGAKYPHIRLLDNPRRIASTALNIGIENASGDVIVRVDGHCVLEPDYISQCVRYLQKTGADNVGGLMRAVGESYVGKAIALVTSSPFGIGYSKFHYSQEEQYVDTVYLGAFRREVFDKVGLFDEELVRNQDYELNYRIRASGGKIFLTPAIKSWYITRNSLLGFWKQYFYYGFSKVRVLKKHPRSVKLRQLVPPAFVLTLFTSGLLGLFSHVFFYLLLAVLWGYLAIVLFSSFLIARKRRWRYLPVLPVTFISLHLSWGLGFLWSLARTMFSRPSPQVK